MKSAKSPAHRSPKDSSSCRTAITVSAITCRSMTGSNWERYRVREIQAVREVRRVDYSHDHQRSASTGILRSSSRSAPVGIVNGSTGSGGDGTPAGTTCTARYRARCARGCCHQSAGVHRQRQGMARGAVTAGWGEVTHSTKGEAIEIGGYELWWRENETLAVWRRASSVVDSLTVTHSPSSSLIRSATPWNTSGACVR